MLAQPRAVGKNGSVTIRVQVDAQAQLAVVTLYGAGLAQQRWITVSRGGVSLIRLRALAPTGCRGSVVARVYVTATGNGRAMTRATTFTVGCLPARVSAARKPARP